MKLRAIFGLLLSVVAMSAVAVAWSGLADAAEPAPSFLFQFPEDGTVGKGAGSLFLPQAVAFDSSTHRVYVTDSGQARVNVFTAWGEFKSAYGWGVKDGSPELQTCTTSCQEGLRGEQPGEFGEVAGKSQYTGPTGIAAGAGGDVYVMDLGNARVQKFDSSGHFLLMFGGGVDKGPSHPGNVCTAQFISEGDICGAGTRGTANGEFAIENVENVAHNYVAVGPDGTVFVADKNRIQAFTSSGVFLRSIPLPHSGNPGALAADPVSGDLYFVFNQVTVGVNTPTIYRLNNQTGAVVSEIVPHLSKQSGAVDRVFGLAVDGSGELFVTDQPSGGGSPPRQVLKYGPTGTLLSQFDMTPGEAGNEPILPTIATGEVGETASEVDIYVIHRSPTTPQNLPAFVNVFGAIPDPDVVGPPPPRAPEITEQYAVAVSPSEATVRAAVNPKFWTDTRSYVEYGPAECKTSACADFPTPPGSLLTKKVVSAPVTSPGVLLTGLQPGTKYFYRFVAKSTGGGPVFGTDPDGAGAEEADFEHGKEATFTTPALPGESISCPENEAFRPAPANKLPDCRAYEMVSPVDKNGADISLVFNISGYPAGFSQSAESGEQMSFAAYRAFGDAVSAPYSVQYLASRGADGWTSRSISPPREGPGIHKPVITDADFEGLSSDLANGWLYHDTAPVLDPLAPAGYPNVYRRDNLTNEYEALITTVPAGITAADFLPVVQGFGGDCTVFKANGKLTSDALANGKYMLYEACKGQPLQLVNVLPEGGGTATEGSAGTSNGEADNRTSRILGAVSSDGSIVYWSNRNIEASPGKLFARVGGTQTVAISKAEAQFWAAATDGHKVIYTEGDALYEFTLGDNSAETGTLIAHGTTGVLGASSDASTVYFVSKENLAAGATNGEPNLYRYEAGISGTFTFIATLPSVDANPGSTGVPGPVKTSPPLHSSQVAADGSTVVFSSVGSLTGYDNRDAETGKPDSEVFLYSAGSGKLHCLSCIASGARPSGREVKPVGGGADGPIRQPTAGEVPGASNGLSAPRVISPNGKRVYFNSYVPLMQGDTNGQGDVYQWETAGEGNCTESSPGYNATYEGCVNLISSGESPQASLFVDSSLGGRDVFFTTASSLLPQDPGLIDVYDAREGGGFPLQTPPPRGCEGEGCQSPPPPPNDPTPPSQGIYPGNQKHCPQGTHVVNKNGTLSCVKNKKKPKKQTKKKSSKTKKKSAKKKGGGAR